MDAEKIRELIELMKENDLSEIRIVDGETRLLLRRGIPGGNISIAAPAAIPPVPITAPPPAVAVDQVTFMDQSAPEDPGLAAICSPMVGTFYASPSPDADPYVKVGDRVTADTVVCIIEAMKVMNEIKAEVAGVIEEVMVEGGNPVEFDQPMFMVRPT